MECAHGARVSEEKDDAKTTVLYRELQEGGVATINPRPYHIETVDTYTLGNAQLPRTDPPSPFPIPHCWCPIQLLGFSAGII